MSACGASKTGGSRPSYSLHSTYGSRWVFSARRECTWQRSHSRMRLFKNKSTKTYLKKRAARPKNKPTCMNSFGRTTCNRTRCCWAFAIYLPSSWCSPWIAPRVSRWSSVRGMLVQLKCWSLVSWSLWWMQRQSRTLINSHWQRVSRGKSEYIWINLIKI